MEVLLSNGETHPLGPCYAVARGWKTRNFEVHAERKADRAPAIGWPGRLRWKEGTGISAHQDLSSLVLAATSSYVPVKLEYHMVCS